MGSGKDTAALSLIETKGWARFAFADVLKESLKVLFLFSDEQVYGDKKDIVDLRWGRSPRHLLQWLGTDVLRAQFDENFFTKHALLQITSLLEKHPGVVVTDCRFDNEAELIRKLNGVVIQIVRNTQQRNPEATHTSEAGVSKHLVDTILVNNESIEALQSKASTFILSFNN